MQIVKPESYIVAPTNTNTTNNNNNNNSAINPLSNNVPGNPFKCTNLFVCGAGKMGTVVAAELAVNGYLVSIHDHVVPKITTLMSRIYDILKHSADQGLLESPADIDAIMDRISIVSSLDAARDADIVFECSADNLATKKHMYGELDRICPKTTIIASNTLNIPLKDFIPSCQRFPGRVLGTRFLYPVLFIPRIELTFYNDPYGFPVKKMLIFLKAIQKKPFFFSGAGEREILSHDQVVAIYADQSNQYKKIGYPGKVTIPRVSNPTDATSVVSPKPASPSASHASATSASTSTTSATSASASTSTSSNTTPSAAVSSSTTARVSPAPVVGSNTSVDASDESKKCVVCMESDRNSVLTPCGHICTCFKCGDSIAKASAPLCPICRGNIKSVVMTFVA